MTYARTIESIPGVDPSVFLSDTGLQLPPKPYLIASNMKLGAGGVVTVHSGEASDIWRSQNNITAGSIMVGLQGYVQRQVIYERTPNPREPRRRQGLDSYADIKWEDAKIVPLDEDESRLVVGPVSRMPRPKTIHIPLASSFEGVDTCREVSRVAEDVDEARMALGAIGMMMGMNPRDAAELARLSIPTAGF